MDISYIVYNVRNINRMNQEEFGKALGVTKSSVNMWESGKRKPSYSVLKLMCDKFNLEEDMLDAYIHPDFYDCEVVRDKHGKFICWGTLEMEKGAKEQEQYSKIMNENLNFDEMAKDAQEELYQKFKDTLNSFVSDDELKLVNAYRKSKPNVKKAIRTLLELDA